MPEKEPYYDWEPGFVAGTVFDPYDDTFGPIMAAIQAGDFEKAAVLLMPIVYLTVDPMTTDAIYVFATSDERDTFAERKYGIVEDEKTGRYSGYGDNVYKTDEPICTVEQLLGK